MLQNIREHTQGWIASIVGGILCIAFAMWGVEYYLNFNGKDGYVAKVNGKKITMNQLNLDYKRLSGRMSELLGPQSLSNQSLQRQLKNQALQNLITQEVLTQAAEKAGYIVSPYWVTMMIKQMPEFKVNNRFSGERFQQVLARIGYTKQEFIADMRQTYLLNQIASGIMGTTFALPYEVDHAIELAEQNRDFIFYQIPVSKYRQTVTITENQINEYYQQHKEEFKNPEKVQIEYIELNADDLKNTIKVTDQEINDYYHANYANDTKKDSLKTLKPKIIQAIIQTKIEQTFSGLNDKLTDLAFTNPNSLGPAAGSLGLQIKESEFFAKTGGTNSLTKNPKILDAAFSDDVLRNGTNSNPIEVGPGHMVVLRMKNHEPESVLPLEKVKDKIQSNLQKNNAAAKVKAEGESFIALLNQSHDITSVLKQHKIAYKSKLHVARHDKDTMQEILQTAFSLPYPNGRKSSIGGVALSNGDYAVVVLNAVHKKPLKEISKQQKDNYEKRLAEDNAKLEYSLYVKSQLSHARIKIKKIAQETDKESDS